MLGRVVMFVAGGWLTMSAFAWPQSELSSTNSCLGGALCIVYALAAIFFAPARYLNTAHACLFSLLSLSIDGSSSAACANNVMVASVIFGASLLPAPAIGGQGARACGGEGSKASRTGWP